MVASLPFALQHSLQFQPDEVSLANMIVVLSFVLFLTLGAPLAAVLVRHFDPSRLVGFFAALQGVCTCFAMVTALLLREQFWCSTLSFACIGGASGGLVLAVYTLTKTLLLAWIVDEDQVIRAEGAGFLVGKVPQGMFQTLPGRRDGIFAAVIACFTISGAAWSGIVQIILGALGYDGELDKRGEPQPESVRMAINFLYLAVIPMLYIACGLTMFGFPLRGKRLEMVTTKYKVLFTLTRTSHTLPLPETADASVTSVDGSTTTTDDDADGIGDSTTSTSQDEEFGSTISV